MKPFDLVQFALYHVIVVAHSWLCGEQMARHLLSVILCIPPQMCQDHGKAEGIGA